MKRVLLDTNVYELVESGKGINQYKSKGTSFNVSVVGSTSKPSDCRTTTPINTLSIKSEIQTGNASSLPFNFIHALPLDTFTFPAPVETLSSLTASIPSSSANSLGNTVKLAPVSTNALTTFDFFLSKSDTSISTHECPTIITNNNVESVYLNNFGLGAASVPISKEKIMNDFIIVSCATIKQLDIVVSEDNKTMLSDLSMKTYEIVNNLEKRETPKFIGFNQFVEEIRRCASL